MLLVVTAEKTGVGKMVFPCYFLYASRRALQLRLDLQYYILVDDGLWRMVGHLTHDGGEIFWGDVHLRGVVVHVSR